MAIIDLVKWDGSPHLLAWKFPSAELSTWTQLVVNETQEAFVVSGGVYDGPFEGGRHVLNTENLPILRILMGLPFGGSSPFTAEVWFVNKTVKLDMKWGTLDPIYLEDPKYKVVLPIRAYGQYGIQVEESKRFLMKLVGSVHQFNSDTLKQYFNGILVTKIRSAIANHFVKRGVSILEINCDIDTLSTEVYASINPLVLEFGVSISQFYIQSVNVPEDDPAVVSLRTALSKKAEMGILGFNYQQERGFDVLEAAAGAEGTAGTIMGAGLGMGMGVGMAGPVSQVLRQTLNDPQGLQCVPNAQSPAVSTDPKQIVELLKEYAQLVKAGILTQEEFNLQKKKLLG